MKDSIEKDKARFDAVGQKQVFAFWDQLNPEEQVNLTTDIHAIDLDEVEQLVREHVKGKAVATVSLDGLTPAPYVPHPARGGDPDLWARAREAGEDALRGGRVAAFTVAGGQGTRLGYDGPKGTFPVTPVTGKTLFGVFADKIRAAEIRYGVEIPWLIMTSTLNHVATVRAFEEAGYFDLKPEQVLFFSQGRMPAVDFEGKILLQSRDQVAMTPDGHGGSLRAMVRSGAVGELKRHGIDIISYFQVDNPLVQVIDPAFIGFHILQKSEMSGKMIPKAYPGEKVGHYCMQDDRMCVIEYSDMPMEMQEKRDGSGRLQFLSGSISINILDVDFVDRVGSGREGAALPFHKAVKKIQTIDGQGNPVSPEEPNGVKFEMFVFDALPFARNPLVIETLREDDFSPVKNPSGVDSAESCKADQIRQWTRWLKAARVELETDETGLPGINFEISPIFADSEEALVERWLALDEKPAITEGAILQ
ncbi:MAG: UTP--glucose-1-phosphate uridylyltransferase [Opitutales bacterium]|jgi:UDP-N-acetylglucosamine/UDP-N-acetylgalactosamine diphosphorylase